MRIVQTEWGWDFILSTLTPFSDHACNIKVIITCNLTESQMNNWKML